MHWVMALLQRAKLNKRVRVTETTETQLHEGSQGCTRARRLTPALPRPRQRSLSLLHAPFRGFPGLL